METKPLNPIADEVFCYFGNSYDVAKAVEILLTNEHEVGYAPVVNLERFVQRVDKDSITMGVRVDWKFVQEDAELPDDDCLIDLRVPIIFAYTRGGNFLPIDGWHRIAKALHKGVTELPAVALTEKESKKIWL